MCPLIDKAVASCDWEFWVCSTCLGWAGGGSEFDDDQGRERVFLHVRPGSVGGTMLGSSCIINKGIVLELEH